MGLGDAVYVCGVLYHTGCMYAALEHTARLIGTGRQMYLAFYNDQGPWSRRWLFIKKTYNKLPRALRPPYAVVVMGIREFRHLSVSVLKGRAMAYFGSWSAYSKSSRRGMSKWRDLIDWVGGYPFEVAIFEQIPAFCRAPGFVLTRLVTCGGGLGCNEHVCRRDSA